MTRVSEETLKHELRVPLSCGSCTSRCQCLSIHAVIYMPAKLFEMRCLADGRRIVNQLLDDVNNLVEKSFDELCDAVDDPEDGDQHSKDQQTVHRRIVKVQLRAGEDGAVVHRMIVYHLRRKRNPRV
jgi:hypothetical protein